MQWCVIVPVKELAVAKSRLAGDPRARASVVVAMACDALAAALGCSQVIGVAVVTNDVRAAAALAPLAIIEPDLPSAGLSAAVRHGAARAVTRWPTAGVCVLAADLPALMPETLDTVLTAASRTARAVVADAEGTGTVLLTAGAGIGLIAAYEGRSRAAHLATGAVDLSGLADARLRRDVDTRADLAAAGLLGVGPATRVAGRAAGWLS